MQLKKVSRWPTWSFDLNNLSYFRSASHPNASYQVSSQLALLFRRRKENQIFKIAIIAAILDFRSKTILAIYDLQVYPMLPAKFQAKWPFGSEEEAKK